MFFCGIVAQQFMRISKYTEANEAWEIQETMHEGTNTVKQSKFQINLRL